MSSKKWQNTVLGVTLVALAISLGAIVAQSQTAPPAQTWRDVAELRGTTSQAIDLIWDVTGYTPTRHVVEGAWAEKSTAGRVWTVPENDVKLKKTPIAGGTRYTIPVAFPGTGHFAFAVTLCNAAGCLAKASSLDPVVARVNGVSRAWVVYRTIATPGAPVPLDAPKPVIETPDILMARVFN